MKRKSEESLDCAAGKRRRRCLSDLPMDVLGSIVSRLPIIDAVRTGTLSSQWIDIWRDHTTLTFNRTTMWRRRSRISHVDFSQKNFVKRVDSILRRHNGVGVERMEIKFPLRSNAQCAIDRWVSFAIASKTKEFCLDLSDPGPNPPYVLYYRRKIEGYCDFPCQLFDADNACSQLQCLQLSSVFLKPTAEFTGFLNLKRLNLIDVDIRDEGLQHLLCKPSILEFLEISNCKMLTKIHAPHILNRLKHLQVNNCHTLSNIEIDCDLTTLDFSGTMASFIIATSSSLTNVHVQLTTLSNGLAYIVTRFVRSFPTVQMLDLQFVGFPKAVSPQKLPKFMYLRHLRLETIISPRDTWSDILASAYLLETAPLMEKLEIHMCLDSTYTAYSKVDGELRSLPLHHHKHLKWVQITGFFGLKVQVELALNILRSSTMLRKMEIWWSREESIFVDDRRVAMEYVRKADHRYIVEFRGNQKVARSNNREGREPLLDPRSRAALEVGRRMEEQDILTRIMSFLPLKEAARTSILSNQWKNIWCSNQNLVFQFTNMLSFDLHKRSWTEDDGLRLNQNLFIERVNAVLKQRSGLGVQTMAVLAELESNHADHIDSWLDFAIASKTKQLILDLIPEWPKEGAPYDFPVKLFNATNSSQLQAFILCGVSLKLPANFKGFQNLKKLKVGYTDVSDEDMHTLVSNCRSLEFLYIYNCDMLTRLWTTHPSNQLKHLRVENCTMLQEIELNFGLTELCYEGRLIPLAPPSPLLMTNVWMKLSDIYDVLGYMFTKLPSTLPHLEMLTINCSEHQRTTLPEKTIKFMYLKHLRLELTFCVPERKVDMLDFACLLEAAPFLETLELHMWMPLDEPYSKNHGELRSLPARPHSNLRLVYITGFYGVKDQLELVRHILRNAVTLNAMKIDPRPVVAVPLKMFTRLDEKFLCFVGYGSAVEYLSKEDHRNVVDIYEIRREDVERLTIFKIMEVPWVRSETVLSYF
uniref:F-box domain-containing protein n=1 Tax=Leersia perrieri TaxID=77586 RepID=A0A0D9WVR5_9ORYZ